jgi:2-keto-3-deoxy-6-phosphogluconate aldolase
LGRVKVVEALREIGIIATVRVPNEQQLLRGVAALTDGGITAVEVPYTTVRVTDGSFSNLERMDSLLRLEP